MKIIVNATALDSGGGLTILNQFLENAQKNIKNEYIVFVSGSLAFEESPNIKYVKVNNRSWLQRIHWDWCGLKAFLKKYNYQYNKVICLQNTSLNVDVEQIIYLHQSIPLTDFSFNLFDKEQFKLFLYKHFYPFFIFRFANNNSKFIVQTKWMKEALIKKFKIQEQNITIIKPDVLNVKGIHLQDPVSEVPTLLYPATPYFYKNHEVLLKAFKRLKAYGELNNLVLQVTFSLGDCPVFDNAVKAYGLISNIDYLGVLPQDKLISMYVQCHAVVFPSYIETFGLPLSEAASLGKKVLCADLPYSRDVLEKYDGALFIDPFNELDWAEQILRIKALKLNECKFSFKPDVRLDLGWSDFFTIINE